MTLWGGPKVKKLTQVQRSKQQSWDLNPGSLAPESALSATTV